MIKIAKTKIAFKKKKCSTGGTFGINTKFEQVYKFENISSLKIVRISYRILELQL